MRPAGVVIDPPPGFDDPLRLGERGEDMLVEALAPEATVEGFDEGILLRLAGRDVVPAGCL